MKKSIFTLFIILFSLTVFAQTSEKKQNFKLDTGLVKEVFRQTDSLLNIWYIKESLKYYNLDSVKSLNHYSDISDTVIIERLKKILTPVPMNYNDVVRHWIDIYLTKRSYLIPVFLSLGDFYFPFFEEKLSKYNIPDEFKYLPLIESALNPFAVSRSGAAGIWQFMRYTGYKYGLEINSFVDERFDVEKSTEAAAKYLRDMYDIFGDWLLVLAAYNSGPGNVRKAIARAKHKTNFWEIYPYLPRETRGYVPAFIAITYVMTYAKEHNFYPVKINFPTDNDTVMITDTLHLIQVAEVLNIPLNVLEQLNPQYRYNIIPGYYKPYPLRLPRDKVLKFIELEDSIYNYKKDSLFDRKIIVTPKPRKRGGYHPSPCVARQPANTKKLIHTVASGETLSHIAQYYNVSVKEIKCWNNKYSSRLNLGEKLVIYVPASKYSYYLNISKMPPSKRMNMIAKPSQPQQKLDPNYVYHKIRKYETISSIAKKYGVSTSQIMKINGFTDYDARHLREGQMIKIKRK